jgi:ribonuclease HI
LLEVRQVIPGDRVPVADCANLPHTSQRSVAGVTFEDALNIYTDGSSLSNPRRGGIGIRYIVINAAGDEEWIDECPPGYKQATNNEMELMACIVALREIPLQLLTHNVQRIYVFTDSQYVRDHIVYAQAYWPKNGWCNLDGKPIENVKLWKDLVREIKNAGIRVDFKWVKGHSTNKHNKAVDKLARESANGFLQEPLTVQSVRRKLTTEKVRLGSVPMQGQLLDIRIVTDKWMREQKVWRYKYEVLPSSSAHAGRVDLIYSEILLRAAHAYRVRVGDNQRNPRIVECVQELIAAEEDASEPGADKPSQ